MLLSTLLLGLLLGQASAPPTAVFQQAFERGLEALSLGQLEAAEAAFQEAARIQPDNAAIQYQLGEVSVRRGKPGEAIARFRRAIELQPSEPQSYLRLAVLQAQLQRFHDAGETVNALLRSRPDYPDAHFLLGRLAEEQGDYALAEEHLRQYLRLNPENLKGVGELGVVLLAQERYQEAENLLQQVLAQEPGSGLAHYNLGLIYNRQGENQKARTHLEVAVRLLPEDAGAYYQLGTALARLGELPEAETALRKALELSADNLEAHYALGTLLSRMGRMEEAAALLAEHERRSGVALEERQRSRRVSAYHLDVKQLLEQNRLEEAGAKLDDILLLDPANDLALYRRGQILFLRRSFPESLANVQAAIQRKDVEPAYHLLEAMCWERLGQDANAAAAYERVLGLSEYADAHAALGQLELRRGNTQRSLAHFRQAVALEPEDPDLRLMLAEVLERTGDRDGARKQRTEAEALRGRTTRP